MEGVGRAPIPSTVHAAMYTAIYTAGLMISTVSRDEVGWAGWLHCAP